MRQLLFHGASTLRQTPEWEKVMEGCALIQAQLAFSPASAAPCRPSGTISRSAARGDTPDERSGREDLGVVRKIRTPPPM